MALPGSDSPVDRLRAYPLGTRVVVRYRIQNGFTDRLGFLTEIDQQTCTIQTRSGPSVVTLAAVVAAKQVPPAPPRRPARRPLI